MSDSSPDRGRPRVVDFSTHVPGPTASRWLAHLGADVIKVEHPRYGDGLRSGDQTFNGEGILHLYLNVGVRSIAVDPRSTEWEAVVKNLVGWADVVIVGNRPARAAELGIDYQSVLSINDNVVYCQITGYGLGGPWSQLGAHGLNIDAMAGSIQVEGRGERVDPVVGFRTVGTNTAGMSAASGIFAALYRRERGLGSQFVHVSVWEAAVSWMWRDALSLSLVGTGMPEHRDAGPRNGVYETADGRHVVVCPIERHFWERFCDALGLPAEMRDRGDWSSGTCDGRGPRAPEERAVIRERILEMTSDEVVTLLSRVDVPASPLLTVGEACASDQAASSGTMMPMSYRGERLSVPSVPVSVISRSDLPSLDLESLAAAHRERAVGLRSPAEWIGQHGDEVRDDLKIERP